jgi:hypothetical protein
VLGEIAAEDTDENGGGVDGAPLHGLEGAGQAQRLAVLDHHGVGQHVVERDAEGHQHDEQRQRPVPGRLLRRQRQPGRVATVHVMRK